MEKQSIRSGKGTKLLYEGNFDTFRACTEQAVRENIDLAGANLRNQNLANACLDDGLFSRADFTGANLSGANLSEASLRGACLAGCDLYNTCLAYTDLRECDFQNASFGATDISGAALGGAHFSTLSCFSLDFASADEMENCRFTGETGESFALSSPPIVIRGFGRKLIVFAEEFWINGPALLPYTEQFHPIVSLRRPIQTSG